MTGAAETYFSAFAIFLKMSAPQVAMLATLPNLLGSLAQLLSAWLGRMLQKRKIIILTGASLQAFALPLMLLPVVFPEHTLVMLAVFITLYYAAAHLCAPQWISLMADLVPARKRGRYFGQRTRLSTITTFTAMCLAGVVLHLADNIADAALGFALLFIVAFISRLLSVYYLGRMHETHPHAAVTEPASSLHWLQQPRFRAALRFSTLYVLMQTAVGISSPFFSIYILRTLEFSYLEFTAIMGISVLVQFLTLNQWGRICDAMGNRLVMITCGAMIPFLPAMWLVSVNFWYLLFVQVVAGFAWAGFSLSAGNTLYELLPRDKQVTYNALQNVIMTTGVFLGSMLGVLVQQNFPTDFIMLGHTFHLTTTILWVFIISTLARIVIAVILLPQLQELRIPRRKISPYTLVFRFTRFNAFSGLIYDIVTRARDHYKK